MRRGQTAQRLEGTPPRARGRREPPAAGGARRPLPSRLEGVWLCPHLVEDLWPLELGQSQLLGFEASGPWSSGTAVPGHAHSSWSPPSVWSPPRLPTAHGPDAVLSSPTGPPPHFSGGPTWRARLHFVQEEPELWRPFAPSYPRAEAGERRAHGGLPAPRPPLFSAELVVLKKQPRPPTSQEAGACRYALGEGQGRCSRPPAGRTSECPS